MSISISRPLGLIAVVALLGLATACSESGISTEPGQPQIGGPRNTGYTVTADRAGPNELNRFPADSVFEAPTTRETTTRTSFPRRR